MEEQCKSITSSDIPADSDFDESEPLTAMQRFRQCTLLVLLGTPSLDRLIEILEQEDNTHWSEVKSRLTDRTTNINIVGSLAVGATAAFLSTPPPTDFARWDHEIPYFCIATSSGSAMLAVMSGLGLVMYLNGVHPESVRGLQKSKLKLAVVVTLLMMPIIFLFSAAFCAVIAWLGAVWFGSKTWMKLIMTIGCLAFPLTLFVIIAALY